MLVLPQELIDIVVDELSNDLRSLLACNSTCRRLRARVRVHLYRSVTFSGIEDIAAPPGHWQLRLSYMDSAKTNIAWSFITYLRLAVFAENDALWSTIIETLGNPACRLRRLEELVLEGDGDNIPVQWLQPLAAALHQCGRSVRYLDLENCCFWQLSFLSYMVSGFPVLRHLAMPVNIGPELDTTFSYVERVRTTPLTISIPANGFRELEIATEFTALLHNEANLLLLVDTFFLEDLLLAAPRDDGGLYGSVKAITLDTRWEDCEIELLLDAFPALEFLCVSVRIESSYFSTSRAWKSTLINLSIRTLQSPAVHFRVLKYLALALSVPAHLALRTLAGAKLDDLCDALCAPHAQHVQLVLVCLLEVGSSDLEDRTSISEPALNQIKADVEAYFEERFRRLSASRRWTAVVAREGDARDGGWRDLKGPAMQKLMARCVHRNPEI